MANVSIFIFSLLVAFVFLDAVDGKYVGGPVEYTHNCTVEMCDTEYPIERNVMGQIVCCDTDIFNQMIAKNGPNGGGDEPVFLSCMCGNRT